MLRIFRKKAPTLSYCLARVIENMMAMNQINNKQNNIVYLPEHIICIVNELSPHIMGIKKGDVVGEYFGMKVIASYNKIEVK